MYLLRKIILYYWDINFPYYFIFNLCNYLCNKYLCKERKSFDRVFTLTVFILADRRKRNKLDVHLKIFASAVTTRSKTYLN